jgi:hypothetical protein
VHLNEPSERVFGETTDCESELIVAAFSLHSGLIPAKSNLARLYAENSPKERNLEPEKSENPAVIQEARISQTP